MRRIRPTRRCSAYYRSSVILIAWEALVRLGLAQSVLHLAADGYRWLRSRNEAQSGELSRNSAVSLREFALGFGAAMIVGLILGVLAGWYRTVEYTLDPFIWFVYSAPLIAFYPLFRASGSASDQAP